MQIKDMTTRQKATIGIFALVVVFLLWQVYGMFKDRHANTMTPTPNTPPIAQMTTVPISAPVAKKTPEMTEREIALMRLQQQTEEKYLAALTELQMLKVERDIAETNKAIATAKFDTVTAQKGTVDLLSKPVVAEGTYSQALTAPGIRQAPPPQTAPTIGNEVSYVVISVTQLQQRWNAVLGYQGKLFTVSVGDVLPADGSKVISIDRSGVTLEKDTVKKKISLVPVI